MGERLKSASRRRAQIQSMREEVEGDAVKYVCWMEHFRFLSLCISCPTYLLSVDEFEKVYAGLEHLFHESGNFLVKSTVSGRGGD